MSVPEAESTEVEGTEAVSPIAVRMRRLARRSSGDVDRWMLVAGAILAPLGLALIVLGWIGAARTHLVFEQNAYLISGGVLGLGFVFLGSFVYFAYWHTVSIRQARSQSQQIIDGLSRIEAALANGSAGTAKGSRSSAANGGKPKLVATANGSQFHRPDCSVVAGKDGLRSVSGSEAGLKPCRICDPLGATVS